MMKISAVYRNVVLLTVYIIFMILYNCLEIDGEWMKWSFNSIAWLLIASGFFPYRKEHGVYHIIFSFFLTLPFLYLVYIITSIFSLYYVIIGAVIISLGISKKYDRW